MRRLRSHLWLKIGTLLSGEASPLSLHFSRSMPCVSHMSTFSLFILRLHPPIWSFTPIKPRDTVLSFAPQSRHENTSHGQRSYLCLCPSYRSHFLVAPSSVALINLAVTKDSDKSPSSVSVVVAVRPPHLVSRRRPRRRRGPRQLDGEEASSCAAASDPAEPSAPLDHLAQPLHALLEAVARDGARRLQVPLPPVPQVAQAQLRLQLVGLQRRGQVLCGGGSVRLPTTGGAS